MQWMGMMIIFCRMAARRMGMLRVGMREVKALTVEMKTLMLIGKGR
jgi:hypothetical protein